MPSPAIPNIPLPSALIIVEVGIDLTAIAFSESRQKIACIPLAVLRHQQALAEFFVCSPFAFVVSSSLLRSSISSCMRSRIGQGQAIHHILHSSCTMKFAPLKLSVVDVSICKIQSTLPVAVRSSDQLDPHQRFTMESRCSLQLTHVACLCTMPHHTSSHLCASTFLCHASCGLAIPPHTHYHHCTDICRVRASCSGERSQ